MRRLAPLTYALGLVAFLAIAGPALAIPLPAGALPPPAGPGLGELAAAATGVALTPKAVALGLLVTFIAQALKRWATFKIVPDNSPPAARALVTFLVVFFTLGAGFLDGSIVTLDVETLLREGLEAGWILIVATVGWIVAFRKGDTAKTT